jgi:hypothetical protein
MFAADEPRVSDAQMSDREWELDAGVDEREWSGRYEALQALIEEAPQDALVELDELVHSMLKSTWTADAGGPGEDYPSELMVEFEQAHQLARRSASGQRLDPGDTAHAINSLRSVYTAILNHRGL